MRYLCCFFMASVAIILNSFFLPCASSVRNRDVNLFMGTAGDHGQTDPAACIPYGMIRVCPDTNPRSHSGYDYNETRISGISVNRLSGVGCKGNGGNLSILPSDGSSDVHLLKETEKAVPGYYSAELDNGVKVQLTATGNVAAERFLYPSGKTKVMTFDASSSFVKTKKCSLEVVSDKEISGFVSAFTTCRRGTYSFWFNLRTSQPFKVLSRDGEKMTISFDSNKNGIKDNAVEVRIAVSPISPVDAAEENEFLSGKNFQEIRRDAARKWKKILGRIDVNGGTVEQRRIFYTSVYRTFLSPYDVTSKDSLYMSSDGTVRRAEDFRYFSSWSIWDSYRTKFPLITMLDPGAMHDICASLARLYMYGKKPWATFHECVPTVRTEHASAVMLDAAVKGVRDFGLEQAYPMIVSELDSLPIDRPDLRLETAIDYLAASGIAGLLGKETDRRRFAEMSESLFRSTWEKDFMLPDESYSVMGGSGLYQGTKWQYRWAVPQYLDIMAASTGGKDALAEQLEHFFSASLNNQGNEPGIHAPYIFNRLGHPEKTQRIVTELLTEKTVHLYGGNAEYPEPVMREIFTDSPDGFLPEMDEDDGTMSAWYVFSSMGIFPLTVGKPHYEISSPIFRKIRIRMQNGKCFVIRTAGRKNPEDVITSVRLNGEKTDSFTISHSQIAAGGRLVLSYR